jgi:uncharacterized protein (DUF433 family)
MQPHAKTKLRRVSRGLSIFFSEIQASFDRCFSDQQFGPAISAIRPPTPELQITKPATSPALRANPNSKSQRARSSGALLVKNSRVPVKALVENLEGGATTDDFLEWFPGVTREQVMSVLEFAQRSLEPA